jgi:hypothetical protein
MNPNYRQNLCDGQLWEQLVFTEASPTLAPKKPSTSLHTDCQGNGAESDCCAANYEKALTDVRLVNRLPISQKTQQKNSG